MSPANWMSSVITFSRRKLQRGCQAGSRAQALSEYLTLELELLATAKEACLPRGLYAVRVHGTAGGEALEDCVCV